MNRLDDKTLDEIDAIGGHLLQFVTNTPSALPNELTPVEQFNYDLLPEPFAVYVQDCAERMGCPADFIAIPLVVAAGAVIGRKVGIYPKRHDNWFVIPNLWGATIGRPSSMKTPGASEGFKPIEDLTRKANQLHDNALQQFKTDKLVNEMVLKEADTEARDLVKNKKIDQAKSKLSTAMAQADTTPPVRKRYTTSDPTVEALGELLIDNPRGVLVSRDELSGWLQNLNKEGRESDRAFYLEGFNGNKPFTTDRISRGKHLHIDSVCISVFGTIQPNKVRPIVRDIMKGGVGDDGLLPRFSLIVYPDDAAEIGIDRKPNTTALEDLKRVFQRLDKLPELVNSDGGINPIEYRFDDAAQDLFDEWRRTLHTRLRENDMHPAIESHLGKYTKLVPAVALIYELLYLESSQQTRLVSERSLLMALAFSEYLETHAQRIYKLGLNSSVAVAEALLRKIKSGGIQDHFSVRFVHQRNWAMLGDHKEIESAVELLCDHGYLYAIERPPSNQGGRRTVTYRIHPSILKVKTDG